MAMGKKTADEISKLINSLSVYQTMSADAVHEMERAESSGASLKEMNTITNKLKDAHKWYNEAADTLIQKYGIQVTKY